MIEILEHPANDLIRKRNVAHLAAHENAEPLITDQMVIRVNGHQVGWLNNHPTCRSGVSLMFKVDDETLEDIQREVDAYLGEGVPIGMPPEPDEEPGEEKPKSQIWTPDGDDDEES